MRRPWKPIAPVALLAASVLAAGCGDGGGTTPGTELEEFAASLSADNVVGGGVASDGTGSAEFAWDGATLEYSIDVSEMENVTAAHIHGPGEVDENANIILTLFAPGAPTGPVSGELVSGSVAEGSSQLTSGFTLAFVLGLMRTEDAYVLVHTVENPDGEIRGQVDPAP